jgi:heat shock protein HslJ
MLKLSALMLMTCLIVIGCMPPGEVAGGADAKATGAKALSATVTWSLKTLTRNGKNIPIPANAKDAPTVSFSKGRMHGTAVCNSYDGTYRAYKTGEFKNYGFSMTEMGCLNMQLEDDFIAMLGSATRFDVTNGTLTMNDGSTKNQLVFAPFKPPTPLPLKGTKWTLQYFGESSKDTDSVRNVAGAVTLTIADDGRVTGSTGCNSYGTSAAVDGKTLVIGDLTMTLLPCASEALRKQESLYTGLLPQMKQFSTTDEQLSLKNADGSRSLIFKKAE